MIEKDVIYIVISDKSTNQERVFTFLKQAAFEFWTQYGDRVKQANRPYSFIEFGEEIWRDEQEDVFLN